ncbi:MAG TPA: thiol-disulfide oxidoreductase DCC family protein [Trueperaceae bacterium]|nr:thiol-disulfide oxidoreductase DCC family protein [Trueperaceae bacterium]
MEGESVILFDGVCNLCNGAVLFIIDRDPRQRFLFAPLQSDFAVELLAAIDQEAPVADADSIVLIEDGRVYQRSEAALRIAKQLRSPWPLLRVFALVPTGLRDRVYDLVARNRYRWFGRQEECRVPTPELRQRFMT